MPNHAFFLTPSNPFGTKENRKKNYMIKSALKEWLIKIPIKLGILQETNMR